KTMIANKKVPNIRFLIVIALIGIGLLAFTTSQAGAEEALKQQLLVDASRIAIENCVADPNMQWFLHHLQNAKGLLIVPRLYKGGFFLGGSGGRAVLLVRDEKTGEWIGPAFYTLGSVTFGLQIGGEVAEVAMMVMTQKGLENLYSTTFKFGGDVSAAAGPYGAGAAGAVSSFNADFLSFTRAKGAFIGLSLEGAVVNTNYEWNKTYYGKPVKPVDIFVGRSVSNPESAELRSAIARLAK
ncbi:MAG: lipid-binding SYLF domain-containing protein, partial [Desulfobacteria bacterium]